MEIIKQRFAEHIYFTQQVAESRILEQVAESAEIIRRALQNGKKVLFCGNGGRPPTVSIWRLTLRTLSKGAQRSAGYSFDRRYFYFDRGS